MLTSFETIPRSERIAVALDCPVEKARIIARELKGKATWLKVGMTLYYAQGPSIVQELKDMGFKVFLDLKLYDIPHQVQGAAASVTQSGADMLTIHASGGKAMMQAALQGAHDAAASLGVVKPLILGITVLTSFDEATLAQIGVSRPVAKQVESLAQLAFDAGIDGVVSSPQEAQNIRSLLGTSACIVTPGVRPIGSRLDDQSRVATPVQAFDAGASHLVIGRPITDAQDYARAWFDITETL